MFTARQLTQRRNVMQAASFQKDQLVADTKLNKIHEFGNPAAGRRSAAFRITNRQRTGWRAFSDWFTPCLDLLLEAPMRALATLTVALGLGITIGCSGSPTDPSRSGNLRVMITDTPFEEATALHVTFTEVKAHREEGTQEWLAVPFAGGSTTRTCNLKKLEGPFDLLGVASLDAGQYTQLRLVVDSARIYFGGTPTTEAACGATLAAPGGSGGTSQALEIPSGEVKLIQPFTLASNGTTTIELDFDGNQSVRQTGNGRYMMSPVIKILSVKTGS